MRPRSFAKSPGAPSSLRSDYYFLDRSHMEYEIDTGLSTAPSLMLESPLPRVHSESKDTKKGATKVFHGEIPT